MKTAEDTQIKKLRTKTFTILVSILTLFLVAVLAIVNIDTQNKYNDIESEIRHIANAYLTPATNNSSNPIAVNINTSLTNLQSKRTSLIYLSIIAFAALEIFIIFISQVLTKWLTRPVARTFAAQQQFISDASHELKTPLAIILASTEMLEQHPTEHKYLHNIQSETEKMNKLVVNLLELSRTDLTITPETFARTDLSHLVETTALTFESLAYEQQLTLVLQITPHLDLNCNSDRIKELLGILIDNAIKHAYANSKITISLNRVKDEIILAVKNRGTAIPEKEREKIFERFYRVDKARNRNAESYGLGLAIAKNITTAHSGHISVDCKNGYTTFSVKLPFRNEHR